MDDKKLKRLVKHIFTTYETTYKIANKIDRCLGGDNDILEPILTELNAMLNDIEAVSLYSITCLLDDLKSGDISPKDATDTFFGYMRG